jgi:flagellar assembly protein FliH
MKETHLSSLCPSVLPLEYQETGGETLTLPLMSLSAEAEPSPPLVIGVSEEEVGRRIQLARDAAVAEADQRVRIECERASQNAQRKVAEALREFSGERAEYFRRVEGEVVRLALSIARKILQREAKLDPTLLSALVRIALDRMQCGSTVQVRVTPEDAELWRRCGDGVGGTAHWEISSDDTLSPGDCIVETELGTANFGFESQLQDVEESFMQLLAHRPDAQSRHAA